MAADAGNRPALSRFEGCLVGLAVGDALGMPAQGLTPHEIRARWGRISDFQPAADLRARQYTACAQTAITLADSILGAGGFEPQSAVEAFREWWMTGDARRPDAGIREACERLARGVARSDAASHSASCGAAPRAAVIGLVDCRNAAKVAEDATACARITHHDARAVAAAVAIATAVAYVVSSPPPLDLTAFVEAAAAASGRDSPQMAAAITGTLSLLELAPRAAMRDLGATDFALEAVPAAIYCFASAHGDFEESVLLAVNSGGAANAVAAMTGALSGAHLGLSGIPSPWVEGVEQSQRLRQLARELHALA